jgi:Domain of unknown function (DUF5134)
MITAPAARWLLTAVFAAAGLTAALPWREPARPPQPADRVPAVFCAVMCAALIVMAWQSEPAAATWLQTALFAGAALGLGLASLAGSGPVRRPSLPALLHALMAGAMIWMLTAMPAATGMPSAGPGRGAMKLMSRAAPPAPVLVVSILLAVSCAAASITWLVRPVGSGPRLKDPASASQAARSAGMAAMLFATL